MNPDTGHLIALRRGDVLPEGYESLPAELMAAARSRLDGQPEAQVNLRSNTPLALWAKKKRLAKIAAKSRRRNSK